MKNLKKLSRQELKSVNGGIGGCTYNQEGVPSPKTCPCNPHTHRECHGVCVPLNQECPIITVL